MKLSIVLVVGLLSLISAFAVPEETINLRFLVELEVNRSMQVIHDNFLVEQFDCTVCSGVLVAQKWILTAANCISNADFVVAYVGIPYKKGCSASYTIDPSNFYIHPNFWEPGLRHNVALIKFSGNTNCDNIGPIGLPTPNYPSSCYLGEYGVSTRWGRYCPRTYPTKLISRNMQVVHTSFCTANSINIGDNELCVFAGKSSFNCNGDIAGPFVSHRTGALIGIMSTVRGFCSGNKPVVFTRIDHYLEWISTTIESTTEEINQ